MTAYAYAFENAVCFLGSLGLYLPLTVGVSYRLAGSAAIVLTFFIVRVVSVEHLKVVSVHIYIAVFLFAYRAYSL